MKTTLLLISSNIFMTIAWYGHLKYRKAPLVTAKVVSWLIAFAEYCFQVPANRLGYSEFTAFQLKIIQEVITLCVFVVFAWLYLGESKMESCRPDSLRLEQHCVGVRPARRDDSGTGEEDCLSLERKHLGRIRHAKANGGRLRSVTTLLLPGYWIELATEENALFAFEPTSRIVPTTRTRMTASVTLHRSCNRDEA